MRDLAAHAVPVGAAPVRGPPAAPVHAGLAAGARVVAAPRREEPAIALRAAHNGHASTFFTGEASTERVIERALALEGRLLDMPDLNEQRSGALVAVYRHFGKHVKVGAGYNFTDFSEDLTDLSFPQFLLSPLYHREWDKLS